MKPSLALVAPSLLPRLCLSAVVTITAPPAIPSDEPQWKTADTFTSAILNSTNFYRGVSQRHGRLVEREPRVLCRRLPCAERLPFGDEVGREISAAALLGPSIVSVVALGIYAVILAAA
ncbi:hypothetical protein H633G_07170 [Metarhizium anisopliae BRIP 53284]|nr:hypothetical protein H633G_07170 [Metarhizium anisopliae BRIP 53284]